MQHLAYLRAQGSLDSHCNLLLDLAPIPNYQEMGMHNHSTSSSLVELARAHLATSSPS